MAKRNKHDKKTLSDIINVLLEAFELAEEAVVDVESDSEELEAAPSVPLSIRKDISSVTIFLLVLAVVLSLLFNEARIMTCIDSNDSGTIPLKVRFDE